MNPNQDLKGTVTNQFGNAAANYTTSAVHAGGADLERIVELAVSWAGENHADGIALDVGCGAGHTAMALAAHVREIVAYDLTPAMLDQVAANAAARGLSNIRTQLGDVESLPYDADTFDIVTSRYSAHHYPHPQIALSEIARILKPTGLFLLSDIVAPETPTEDTYLQTIELLRDPSHVRDHRISEWERMFNEAGFTPAIALSWSLPLEFTPWVQRIGTPTMNIEMLKRLMDGATSEVRTFFNIQPDYTFSIPGALFAASFQ